MGEATRGKDLSRRDQDDDDDYGKEHPERRCARQGDVHVAQMVGGIYATVRAAALSIVVACSCERAGQGAIVISRCHLIARLGEDFVVRDVWLWLQEALEIIGKVARSRDICPRVFLNRLR